MREITTFRPNRKGEDDHLNDRIRLEVADDADRNGVNHRYQFFVYANGEWEKLKNQGGKIDFHQGPVLYHTADANNGKPMPLTGVSDQAVLAVLVDHLQAVSKGPDSSRAKSIALTHLETALHWLNSEEARK